MATLVAFALSVAFPLFPPAFVSTAVQMKQLFCPRPAATWQFPPRPDRKYLLSILNKQSNTRSTRFSTFFPAGYWIFGAQFCDTWVAFDVMCSTASILNLCAISMDRYIHIKDPLR